MFLIPIGHEQETVRRLPWITFSILALCFIVHIFISMEVSDATRKVEQAAQELITYYINHPYLEFDAETKDILFSGIEDEQMEEMLSYYRLSVPRPSPAVLEGKQEEFKLLSQNFISALNKFPYRKWGFIPADQKLTGLLTYMFIHGGWLHLLGNLLFLYLTGPFIEDLWGKPLFVSFYLVAGMLSALLYAQHYPNFNGALIGASGAIAGVMGAFLIKYWKIKIRFFYFIFPFFRGTFSAPAWLMLPLWVLLELFNAKIVDSLPGSGGGGVAHWAHVWGFVVGMAIALGITKLKVEEKFIKPKIDAKLQEQEGGFDVVAQAIRVKNLGMIKDAHAMLLDEALKHPGQKDVVETLWEFGHELKDPWESTQVFIKFIEKEIRQDQLDSALIHFLDLKQRVPDVSISPVYKFTLIKLLIERNDLVKAKTYAAELIGQIDSNVPPLVLQNFAAVALKLSPAIAEKVIEICLQHPEIPGENKDILKKQLLELNPNFS